MSQMFEGVITGFLDDHGVAWSHIYNGKSILVGGVVELTFCVCGHVGDWIGWVRGRGDKAITLHNTQDLAQLLKVAGVPMIATVHPLQPSGSLLT